MSTHPEPTPASTSRGRALGLFGLSAALTVGGVLAFSGALLPATGSKAATQKRTEPLLPKFEGRLLDGSGKTGTDLLKKQRALLWVFASTDRDATRVAELLARLAPQARKANVALLGIARDRDPASARNFIRAQGFDFPVLHDHDLSISRKLNSMRASSSLIAVDAQGYLVGGFLGLTELDRRVDEMHESRLREVLYLPHEGATVTPDLGVLPEAPAFEVRRLDGKRLSLASLRGKIVVLVFFLPTCPHCHQVLGHLDRLNTRLAHPELAIIAVSVSPQKYVVEEMAEDLDLKLAMYTDPGGKAASDYAHRHTVPDTLVINRQGRVVGRRSGASPRIEALLTMEIRQALGVDNPILLERIGYSGEEACRICHQAQHATSSLTSHTYAFHTLAEHGELRNPECLPCHTVGWAKPGGYDLQARPSHLEGVQCESCHGRGGPHQSPDFLASGYEPICGSCHTPEHSLRFVFAERLPLVSHKANEQFAHLTKEERRTLLARRDVRERQLFDKGEFVGSAACQECHAKEYELWSASSHARAFASLRKGGEQRNTDCQKCHTTGFGETSGWPRGGEALAQVGCESCHGPGAAHVKDEGKQRGMILALTDKCDSCVIMQICGSCHDDANDPGFEFELNDKIDRIRHGFRDVETASR